MTAPRDPDSILTTVRPQDRIPSHGTQLSADGTADLDSRRPTFGRPALPPARGTAPLNLWDASADSLPETWSPTR